MTKELIAKINTFSRRHSYLSKNDDKEILLYKKFGSLERTGVKRDEEADNF